MLKCAAKQKHWYSLFEGFFILGKFWSCPGLYLRIIISHTGFNSGLHSVLLGKHLLSPLTPVSFVKAVVLLVEQKTWPAGPCRRGGWPLTWFTPNTCMRTFTQTSAQWRRRHATSFCFCVRWLQRGSVWAGGERSGRRLTGQRTDQSILWDSGVKVIIYELVYLVALQPAVCCPVLAAFPSKASLRMTGQNSHCSLLV